MTITQTVEIPENRRLIIDVPREVPTGRTVLAFTPASELWPQDQRTAAAENSFDVDGDCPLCAKYRDPETGELRPNAETAAAIREGRAMVRGEIPGKLYSSFEEMLADLDKDDD